MKRLFMCLLIALCGVFVLSCRSKKQVINYENQSIFISPGMDKEKVIDIMGIPGNRQFNGSDEAWQYHRNGFWSGYDKIYVIWFYKGIVTGLTTSGYPSSGITAMYYPINWTEKPDYTIEIRHR